MFLQNIYNSVNAKDNLININEQDIMYGVNDTYISFVPLEFTLQRIHVPRNCGLCYDLKLVLLYVVHVL